MPFSLVQTLPAEHTSTGTMLHLEPKHYNSGFLFFFSLPFYSTACAGPGVSKPAHLLDLERSALPATLPGKGAQMWEEHPVAPSLTTTAQGKAAASAALTAGCT